MIDPTVISAGFQPNEPLPNDAADLLVACYLQHAGGSSDRDIWLSLAEHLSFAQVRAALKRLKCVRVQSKNRFYPQVRRLTDTTTGDLAIKTNAGFHLYCLPEQRRAA